MMYNNKRRDLLNQPTMKNGPNKSQFFALLWFELVFLHPVGAFSTLRIFSQRGQPMAKVDALITSCNINKLDLSSASQKHMNSISMLSALASLSTTSQSELSPEEFNDNNAATNNNVSELEKVQTGKKGRIDEKFGYGIPSTYPDAIRRFFFGPDHGPIITSIVIVSLIIYRIVMVEPIAATSLLNQGLVQDTVVGSSAIAFWIFQEYFLHRYILHSKFNWIGKDIHDHHHDKPYFHISIDPTPLLLGWLLTAHFILRTFLPLHLALSGTICYAIAGMWYEWTHYIVHTKVKPNSKFMKQVKNNHIRHHLVSQDYWLGFSLPLVDDLFDTNPNVKEVRRKKLD